MKTSILFNPIIKYFTVFIIAYMFLCSININENQLIKIILFILLLSIVTDILMLDDFVNIIKQE
jgi:hypothetical protein